ncbi:helix-turn-helix domain-containing protein [Micromonospora sp. NBC_01813]|uniref:helix-turn-helix domain-containing protein n=1 Tax=Micromonospora sp. NBC_01813 TaxID=2975988 RepID=UPI002DD7DE59|nr:helix-turn-helix domain-containing protein [Micromonospora sp. NBC_01813]WSA07075.1 helix-turn-helix domain-containing protein [Micromonospora sp. NBC_01813]
MESTPLLVTTVEAAQRLGCGRTTVYELIARGELETVTIGRLRRVPVDAIADYVNRLREQAKAAA